MTVLHAIALAGGFDKVPMEPWQVTELTRETTRLQTALDRAMRMIARNTAIEAARTTDQPIVPVELTDLAGKEKASSLVYTEFAPRRAEMVALTSDEAALKGAVDSAAAELELNKSRVPILHQAIEMRRERVDNLSKLLANGTIARPVLMQAQTELMDVQDRSRETMKAINLANDRYNQARQQLQARHDQAQIFVQKDANDARTEAAVAAGEIDAAANVLKAMTRTQLSSASASETEFMIIRRQGDGVTQFTATDTTLLEPGDLVQARSQGAPGARN
jgi:predicted  nucleic acid-binding Zn-ribbon protein